MLDFKRDKTITDQHIYVLRSKFFYLLCALIFYFLGTSLFFGSLLTSLINTVLLSAIIVFCIYPLSQSKKILLLVLVLGICILTTHFTVVFYDRNESIFIFLYSICTCFLLVVTYSVIYAITQHKKITIDSLFGAICAYFLIGFTWTFVYLLINTIDPSSFPANMLTGGIHERTQHFFYFSFTTLTTLGYGDILPLSNLARTCSWLEAVMGQIYLAVWISQLVGLRITQEMKNR